MPPEPITNPTEALNGWSHHPEVKGKLFSSELQCTSESSRDMFDASAVPLCTVRVYRLYFIRTRQDPTLQGKGLEVAMQVIP